MASIGKSSVSALSGVVSLSSSTNPSSFENSCTGLVSEVTENNAFSCSSVVPGENSTSMKALYHGRGGITCCVPNCNKNSLRNKKEALSFYVIPKDPLLRRRWLRLIKREKFAMSSSHRVCSVHFVGGKKTYMNNTQTLNLPGSATKSKSTPCTTRNSIEGRKKIHPKRQKLEEDVNCVEAEPVDKIKQLQKKHRA